MTTVRWLAPSFASACLLLAACGGRTVGGESGDGGSSGKGGGGGDGGVVVTTNDAGAACVNIELAADDQACDEDSDCNTIRTGEVCSGECSCGDVPVNAAGAALFESDTSALSLEACPCASPGITMCIAHVCTLCGFGPNPTPGCPGQCGDGIEACDAGVGFADAGTTGSDAGTTSDDAGPTCVDINPTAFSTACVDNTGCVLIQTGEVCDGDCNCGGGLPVSASDEAQWQADVSSIKFGECACPAEAMPVCVSGQCVSCAGAGAPPECQEP